METKNVKIKLRGHLSYLCALYTLICRPGFGTSKTGPVCATIVFVATFMEAY